MSDPYKSFADAVTKSVTPEQAAAVAAAFNGRKKSPPETPASSRSVSASEVGGDDAQTWKDGVTKTPMSQVSPSPTPSPAPKAAAAQKSYDEASAMKANDAANMANFGSPQ